MSKPVLVPINQQLPPLSSAPGIFAPRPQFIVAAPPMQTTGPTIVTPGPPIVAQAPTMVPIHRPSIPNLMTTINAVQRFRAPLLVAGPRPMGIQRAVVPVPFPVSDPFISDRASIISTRSSKPRKSTAKIAPDASYLENDEVIVEKVNQYECCECCGGYRGRCPLWLLVILSIIVFLVILGIVLVVVFTLVKF